MRTSKQDGRTDGRTDGSTMSSPMPSWVADLEAFIVTRRQQLEQLEHAVGTVRQIFGAPTPAATGTGEPAGHAARGRGRRAAIRPNSLQDRILSVLQDGPKKTPALVAACKAPKSAVWPALTELLKAGRVEKAGKSRATTYAIGRG